MAERRSACTVNDWGHDNTRGSMVDLESEAILALLRIIRVVNEHKGRGTCPPTPPYILHSSDWLSNRTSPMEVTGVAAKCELFDRLSIAYCTTTFGGRRRAKLWSGGHCWTMYTDLSMGFKIRDGSAVPGFLGPTRSVTLAAG